MKKNKQNAQAVNNSIGLAPIAIEDATTTRGKVSAKYTLDDQAAAEEKVVGRQDKNQVFAQVTDAVSPVHFDADALVSSLKPIVESGIMSEDVMQATINKARAEFMAAHAAEIEAAESLPFGEIIAKIQAVPGLLAKVLKVCNVESLDESDYIRGGQCLIYRAAQSFDKDGRPRYELANIVREVDGKAFTAELFCERRPISASNIVVAIRYHQSFLDAQRRLEFSISKHRAALKDVEAAALKAKEAGFSLEQIGAVLKKVFA